MQIYIYLYEVEFSEGAVEDLAKLRAFDRRRILDAIEAELRHEPTSETRRRKMLVGLVTPFEPVPPIWELRVREHRIFHDASEGEKKVYVRAVRHKPPHKTTEEIL